ncbi:HD domain-containing protein [bacterium]|nr:HD domain-containing protein [bacterium]
MDSLKKLISPQYPRLVNRVKKIIERSEKDFSPDLSESKESFLWEHTVLVSSLAKRICSMEGEDPFLVVVAALFHDVGKFYGGEYHKEETPEEHLSSRIAKDILSKEGMEEEKIKKITSSLEALYNENKSKNRIADVVHDSDFLAKTGFTGAAQFFIKTTLRKQPMIKSLVQSSSKEMTYASVLPRNMRTKAGKKMAYKNRKNTLSFFKGLFQELEDRGIIRFVIKEVFLPSPKDPQKSIKVMIVLPQTCPECQGAIGVNYSSKKGIKCTKLIANMKCRKCSQKYKTSFCLPEVS